MTSRLEGVIIILCLVLSLTAILYMGTGGADGPIGPPGVQGVAGTAGTPGLTGPPGAQGPTGLAGTTGTPGPQGIQGIQGIQGLPGEMGSVVGDLDAQLYTENFKIYRGWEVVLYGSGFPSDPFLYFKDSAGKVTYFGQSEVTRSLFREKLVIPVTASRGLGYFVACKSGVGEAGMTYATWPIWVK